MPVPDRALFDREVYPVLLRDCGFAECHGAPNRFLKVFGPGRSRLPGHPSDPDLVPREKEASYRHAAAMLISPAPDEPWRAPLLKKPLERSLGGTSHGGTDAFGRNAFQSVTDPRYKLFLEWARTAQVPVIPLAPAPPPPAPAPPTAAAPVSGAPAPAIEGRAAP